MPSLSNTVHSLRLWWQRKIWLKRHAPNHLFPVRNEGSGKVIWFETNQTHYGLFVTIHQHKPHLKSIGDYSRETAMAGVHIDFFTSEGPDEEAKEEIKLQLYDASVGPYAEPHWDVPLDHDQYSDASIILVPDVWSWRPDPEDVLEDERPGTLRKTRGCYEKKSNDSSRERSEEA